MTPRTLTIGGLVLTAALLLGGCGTDPEARSGGPVRVVASTNVYGDIARRIGGAEVQVTSILSNPNQDPHSFEANPRTALSIARASLLIENGGGYDDYMGRLRASSKSTAPVIDVVRLSGKKASANGYLNEHVFYDFPTMKKFADDLARHLGAADPAHRADFEARAATFDRALDTLIARERAIASTARGKGIGITEPVPLYLTAACGLVNRTPPAFSEAVEDGNDVSAAVLQQTLTLFTQKQVAALVFNEQTSGPITQKVQAAARAAGIPVVPVTETLPAGKNYLSWMTGNLDAVQQAVG